MNDRFSEMNNFIRLFGQVYEQNPDLPINSDTFYSALTKYDLSKEEKEDGDIKNYFEYWQQHFKNKENLTCFWTPQQHRFLQFRNSKGNYGKEYKLYLSFSKDKIKENVDKIFEFIESNNMENYSKVADVIRSDAVVLRMTNKDDALKVMNFINNDPKLVSDAKLTNPFLMRNGVCGFGYDDSLSYNNTLCGLFEKYFKNAKENNKLNSVSLDDFKSFSDQYYKDTFINCSNLKNFNYDPKNFSDRFETDGEKLVNYQQVYALINSSLSNNLDFNSYSRFVENCRDRESNFINSNYYNSIVHYKERYNREVVSNNIASKKSILDNYIVFASNKYGNPKIVASYLIQYSRGVKNAITRDSGFRDLFIKNISKEDIMSLTNNDILSYIGIREGEKTNKKENSIDKLNIFSNACIATFNKHGYNQLYNAILKATMGDFGYFTNDNNWRKLLIDNINNTEIYSLCVNFIKKKNYELSNGQDVFTVFCDLVTDNNQNINNKSIAI